MMPTGARAHRIPPCPLLGLGRARVPKGNLSLSSWQVTEGPVDEIIRPRPQGSSPVYECAAEGAGFGLSVSLLHEPHGLRADWVWGHPQPRPSSSPRVGNS